MATLQWLCRTTTIQRSIPNRNDAGRGNNFDTLWLYHIEDYRVSRYKRIELVHDHGSMKPLLSILITLGTTVTLGKWKYGLTCLPKHSNRSKSTLQKRRARKKGRIMIFWRSSDDTLLGSAEHFFGHFGKPVLVIEIHLSLRRLAAGIFQGGPQAGEEDVPRR